MRSEWIAAAVVVFTGVRQAALIGSMMARIAAQVAGRFATVPIFIIPSEFSAPFVIKMAIQRHSQDIDRVIILGVAIW